MKKHSMLAAFILLACCSRAQVIDPKAAAKNAATSQANSEIQSGANNAAGAADKKIKEGVKGLLKKKTKTDAPANTNPQTNTTPPAATPAAAPARDTPPPAPAPTNTAALKAYNNYDFVPGDTILMEDHFTDDQDGEFPAHWKLITGQGVINNVENEPMYVCTQGGIVTPRMKKPAYLPNQYTVEYDYYVSSNFGGLNQINLMFDDKVDGYTEGKMNLSIDHANVNMIFVGGQLNQNVPADLGGDGYYNKWHHMAVAVKDKQVKVYVDQFRVLSVPDCGYHAGAVGFTINGTNGNGIIGFKNFRLAKGGRMNMLTKKFTDTKIITHGINFDYNKASIRPESMGTLNAIVQILKDNPEVTFEIGGHTDGDGNDGYNMTLSQQRADAVKAQLVKMGIDAARLSTKGYGKTKPISDNTTPEGKANNRRVEFVKTNK